MKGKQLYLTGLQDDESPKQKQHEVHLRLDSLILSGVVMVLLLALSFSLGVERGKRSAMTLADSQNSHEPSSAVIALPTEEAALNTVQEPTHPITVEQPEQEPYDVKPEPQEQGYRIQVASFRKEDSAQRETNRLLENGYNAYHNRSGNYIVIYVGGYNDIGTAKGALQALREKYKDCILKKL